jgi:hypothetical protein
VVISTTSRVCNPKREHTTHTEKTNNTKTKSRTLETFLNILLVIVQFGAPLVVFLYARYTRKRIQKFNEETRQVYEELLENRRENNLTTFLERNPEIDPEIFVEKKEPIVPKREKPRHHFNHEGGDYFM